MSAWVVCCTQPVDKFERALGSLPYTTWVVCCTLLGSLPYTPTEYYRYLSVS